MGRCVIAMKGLNFALPACLLLAGCQLLLDVDAKQCDTDVDCQGILGRGYRCADNGVCIPPQAPMVREDAGQERPDTSVAEPDAGLPPLPSNWSCLRQPAPEYNPIRNQTVSVRLSVTDYVSEDVPGNLQGKACRATDIGCEQPVIDYIGPNAQGYLVFEALPHGFDGFFELEAPGYVDVLTYSNRPYIQDHETEGPVMLTAATINRIAEGGGEEFDGSTGIVILTVYDCDGEAAPGVRFEQEDTDSDERPFYFATTLPDRDRTETVVSRQLTRSRARIAVGGFSKVKPGYLTLVGTLAATGDLVGKVTLAVRGGHMSYGTIEAGHY